MAVVSASVDECKWMSISRCKMLLIFLILWGNLQINVNLLINSLMKKQLFLVVVAALAGIVLEGRIDGHQQWQRDRFPCSHADSCFGNDDG